MNTPTQPSFWGSKWCYLLALNLAVVPFLWGNGIIDAVDVSWSDNPLSELLKRISGIDPSINGGADRSNNYATLLWMALLSLVTSPFYDSGILSPVHEIITQRLFFGVVIFIIASIFFRTCEILSKQQLHLYAAIIAGIYFCYSYYFYFAWARLQLNILSVPLFLATLTLAQAVHQGTFRKEWLYYFLPCCFISATIGLQPPLIALWLFQLIILALFGVATLRHKIHFILLALVGFGLMHSYWIVPFVAFIHENQLISGSHSKELFNVMNLFDWVSGFTTYANVLAGAADFTFYDGYVKPYNPAAYQSLMGATPKKLLLIAISVASIAYSLKHYKASTGNIFRVLCLLYLMSVVISLGGYGLQGKVMRYLVSEAPLFWVFRATWQKAGMLELITISIMFYFVLRELFMGLATKKFTRLSRVPIANKVVFSHLTRYLKPYMLLCVPPLIVALCWVYIPLRVPSDTVVELDRLYQFLGFTFIVSSIYVIVVFIVPKQHLSTLLAYVIPAMGVLYFAGLLAINDTITEGFSTIPRAAYWGGFALLVLSSLVYRNIAVTSTLPISAQPRWDYRCFVALLVTITYIHFDFIKGAHFPSHKEPGGYAAEVQAGYRPEIPSWIHPLAKQVDQPGCMSILLPISRANLISWGWGGSSDVLVSRGLLQQSTLIFKEYGEGYTVSQSTNAKYRNAELFSMLTSNRKIDLSMLREMGICYFILRTDFNDRKDFTDLPTSFYIKKLNATKGLTKTSLAEDQNPHNEKVWQLYKVGEPLQERNGRTLKDFLFAAHFSYYLNSPDPEIEQRFVKVTLPNLLKPSGRETANTLLIAKPLYYFLWGCCVFMLGLAGLWVVLRFIFKDQKV